MQKSVVFLLFTVFSTSLFADNTEDYAQSRPKSSVKINTVTETLTTTGTLSQNGEFQAQNQEKVVQPSEETLSVEPATSAIPAASVVYPDKDYQQSRRELNKALDKLSKDNPQGMISEIETWANQVAALETNPHNQKIIEHLRKEIYDLEVAVANNESNVGEIIDGIFELTKRRQKQYFSLK
ncbi:MAG: hypothetical protein IJ566_07885 [Cardiobacteriaceae bacterium]|nr:hypothetical protein [Cardiobacteriaceae bacterium]